MAKTRLPCPKWLDKVAQTEWKRVVKELGENSEVKAIDSKALEIYVVAYSKWQACEKALQEKGLVMTTSSGYEQQRPEVAIAKQAAADVRAFQRELGLTPAARSRISKNSSNEMNEDVDKEMEDMIAK